MLGLTIDLYLQGGSKSGIRLLVFIVRSTVFSIFANLSISFIT